MILIYSLSSLLPRITIALYTRKRVPIGGLTHLSRQGIRSAWNMNAMRLGRESRSRKPRYFIMWELELIPVYILLSMWGGKKRLYSATKWILYTAGGSVFLLIAVLGIALYGSNEPTLNFETLANQSYPIALEIILYIGFFIAFAVKSPIIPLHTWLPDTHGEAHYSTCMLLAGILLKMGAYGLVRINMEFLSHAHSLFSPCLVIVGTMQIIYAASTSLGQRNFKKRIAYSSVSHMGFIIIGIGSINDIGAKRMRRENEEGRG